MNVRSEVTGSMINCVPAFLESCCGNCCYLLVWSGINCNWVVATVPLGCGAASRCDLLFLVCYL